MMNLPDLSWSWDSLLFVAIIALMLVPAFKYLQIIFVGLAYPLHFYILNGNTRRAKRLIDTGTDLNRRDGKGETPLYLAVREGRTEVAELLILKGADVNARTNAGETPLKAAEASGRKTLAELLKQHGAVAYH